MVADSLGLSLHPGCRADVTQLRRLTDRMAQLLAGQGHRATVEGLLAAPFARRPFVFAYVAVLSAHALVTKTLPLWAVLFAVAPRQPGEGAAALLWAGTACAVTAAAYGVRKKDRRLVPFLWAAGLLVLLLAGEGGIPLAAVAGSLGAAALLLGSADPYDFCPPVPAGKAGRHTGCPGSVGIYLVRYFLANKTYLVNTAGLCVLAVLLPRFFGGWSDCFSLGLALLCLNTPCVPCSPGTRPWPMPSGSCPAGGGDFAEGMVLSCF